MARAREQYKSSDEGVILVFWVLCFPLLAALLVGVIELGDLFSIFRQRPERRRCRCSFGRRLFGHEPPRLDGYS